jgi:2,5-diketo-D-gluconate reductase B
MPIGRVFETSIQKDIAAHHRSSVAQIVLRWLIQQPRVLALSRTENVERIAGNMAIFDFKLTDTEMAAIAALKSPGSRIVNPAHLAHDWD